MEDRVEELRRSFGQEKMDGYLVADQINIQYFTGFVGGTRLLIPKDGDCVLYAPTVNYEAAKEYVKDVEIEPIRVGDDVNSKVAGQVKRLGLRLIGFDLIDASAYLKLKQIIGNADIEPADKLVSSLRRVKDKEEQRRIREASKLTSLGMKRAFEIIKAGMKERELASEIEYAMRRNGSDGTAFDTIVVSGVRSAFPHGGCGDQVIANGDLVVIDIGAKYQSYCSDLTRTFAAGETSSKREDLYSIVLSAQDEAMREIKPGVEARIVDAKARDLIKKHGYGEYFVHSLGHGVGLEVHELPTLSLKSEERLEVGNVVTVEPGIYIPGFGGIRIEDTVLVKEDGYERLTEAPYTLRV